jgi:hypothetical protein
MASGEGYFALARPEADLEYTHVRVCACGRRVAAGLECYHGAPVLFVHPEQAKALQRLAAMFSAPLPGKAK